MFPHPAANAASVADPEVDYMNTPEDVCANIGILKSPQIARMDLDLYGDGRPTIFLSFTGAGSKSGKMWTAYSPTSGGYERAEGVQFREDMFRAGRMDKVAPDGGLTVLFPGKNGGDLMHYHIRGGHVELKPIKALDYDNPEDRELFERIFQRKPDEPLPQSYFENPPHKVVSVEDVKQREQNAEAASRQVSPPEKRLTPDSSNPGAPPVLRDMKWRGPPPNITFPHGS